MGDRGREAGASGRGVMGRSQRKPPLVSYMHVLQRLPKLLRFLPEKVGSDPASASPLHGKEPLTWVRETLMVRIGTVYLIFKILLW